MKIALIQSGIHWNDAARNLSCCELLIKQAAADKARLVILPEMFSTGFSLLSGRAAREVAMKSSAFLEEQAAKHGVYVSATQPWAPDENYDRPFNTMRVYGPSGHLGDYSKRHLFGMSSKEAALYRQGSDFLTLAVEDLRVSFFICYDLRFPLAFRRLAENTDLFVLSANWPLSRLSQWRTLLCARAIDNQAYVAGCNAVTEGDGVVYAGASLIADPLGAILAEAADQETIIYADLCPERIRQWRESFSILADGRADFPLFHGTC